MSAMSNSKRSEGERAGGSVDGGSEARAKGFARFTQERGEEGAGLERNSGRQEGRIELDRDDHGGRRDRPASMTRAMGAGAWELGRRRQDDFYRTTRLDGGADGLYNGASGGGDDVVAASRACRRGEAEGGQEQEDCSRHRSAQMSERGCSHSHRPLRRASESSKASITDPPPSVSADS